MIYPLPTVHLEIWSDGDRCPAAACRALLQEGFDEASKDRERITCAHCKLLARTDFEVLWEMVSKADPGYVSKGDPQATMIRLVVDGDFYFDEKTGALLTADEAQRRREADDE